MLRGLAGSRYSRREQEQQQQQRQEKKEEPIVKIARREQTSCCVSQPAAAPTVCPCTTSKHGMASRQRNCRRFAGGHVSDQRTAHRARRPRSIFTREPIKGASGLANNGPIPARRQRPEISSRPVESPVAAWGGFDTIGSGPDARAESSLEPTGSLAAQLPFP